MSASLENAALSDDTIVTPRQTDPTAAAACYLIVAVSDIRGFTSLTSRVNHFCQSRLNLPSEVDELSKDYIKYMRETQDIASTTMKRFLTDSEEDPAVVKSTGDGYMVAVRLAPIQDGALADTNEREKAAATAAALLDGLRLLVESARPKEKMDHPEDTFAGKTLRLIQKWGAYLGISEDDYRFKRADLYIAGGIALGTGFFSDKSTVVSIQTKDGLVPKTIIERDAFGHAANLAFRLCDKAGRDKVPDILLDRRVGKLVEAQVSGKKDHAYKLRAHRAPLELKGIEENWCMSYSVTD